jgi:hypothetical protein
MKRSALSGQSKNADGWTSAQGLAKFSPNGPGCYVAFQHMPWILEVLHPEDLCLDANGHLTQHGKTKKKSQALWGIFWVLYDKMFLPVGPDAQGPEEMKLARDGRAEEIEAKALKFLQTIETLGVNRRFMYPHFWFAHMGDQVRKYGCLGNLSGQDLERKHQEFKALMFSMTNKKPVDRIAQVLGHSVTMTKLKQLPALQHLVADTEARKEKMSSQRRRKRELLLKEHNHVAVMETWEKLVVCQRAAPPPEADKENVVSIDEFMAGQQSAMATYGGAPPAKRAKKASGRPGARLAGANHKR